MSLSLHYHVGYLDVDLREADVVVGQSEVGHHRPSLGLLQVAATEEHGADRQDPAVDLLQVDQRVVLVDRLNDAQAVAVVGDVLHAVHQHQIDEKTERRRDLFERLVAERDREIPHVLERVDNEVVQRAVVSQRLLVDVDLRLAEVHLGEILVHDVLEVTRRPVRVLACRRRGQRLDGGREGFVNVQLEAVNWRSAAEVQRRGVAQRLHEADRFQTAGRRIEVPRVVQLAHLPGVVLNLADQVEGRVDEQRDDRK